MILAFASAFLFLIPTIFAQQLCNGYAEFCTRSYGNVTFIGAHDSAFVSTTDALTANQHYDVTTQLNDGIRMLQSQGHNKSGSSSIELCHTDCELFDAGTLLSYLQQVKSWLDQNPDEVLTMLFTNSDGIDIQTWAGDFASAGIADLAFVPSFTTTPGDTLDWPTLGSMISSGKRVVIFLDAGADPTTVNYILPEFTYMWETPFDQTDPSFPCTVNRPPSIVGQFPTGRLSVINHFLDTTLTAGVLIPDVSALNVTNAVSGAGSLGAQIESCSAFLGRYPNFLLVDYYDVSNGSVFQVAATANGVPYHPSADVLKNANTTSPTAKGVPTSAAARKVLPIFVIMQVALSGLTIAGAFWLAWGDDASKYDRLEDRSTKFIPSVSKGHAKYASIGSVGSEGAFGVELERGRMLGGHNPRDSVTNLASHGALMGVQSERGSMESERSDEEDGDEASLRRMLDNPIPQRGFLENRRDSLHLS